MALKDRLYGVPVLGTALRVQDRYKDDAADQLAASIGFFAFLSMFPLIILAIAIGGFVVRFVPGSEADVARAIREAIPGLSGLTGTGAEGLVDTVAERAGAIAGVGAVTLLLSGLRVVTAAMVATTRVFRMSLPEGIKGWGRRLGALGLLGVLALLGAMAGAAIGVDVTFVPDGVEVVVTVLVTLTIDVALFLVAYRILAAGQGPAWRELFPGALLAGTGWTALKGFGSIWVANQAAKAQELYGVFGGIIALMLLLYLAGRLYLYGAELSAVRCEWEGPRDDEDAGPADGTPATDRAPLTDALDGRQGRRVDPAAPDPGRNERDAPPPAAPRPGPRDPSPAVGTATRQRLATADRRPVGRTPVKHAAAFSLAIGALGALVYAMRPWASDDD